jgi:hypothetical protein
MLPFRLGGRVAFGDASSEIFDVGFETFECPHRVGIFVEAPELQEGDSHVAGTNFATSYIYDLTASRKINGRSIQHRERGRCHSHASQVREVAVWLGSIVEY